MLVLSCRVVPRRMVSCLALFCLSLSLSHHVFVFVLSYFSLFVFQFFYFSTRLDLSETQLSSCAYTRHNLSILPGLSLQSLSYCSLVCSLSLSYLRLVCTLSLSCLGVAFFFVSFLCCLCCLWFLVVFSLPCLCLAFVFFLFSSFPCLYLVFSSLVSGDWLTSAQKCLLFFLG